MIDINSNYKNLPANYLFSEVAKKIKQCGKKDIINLSIGDATRPLAPQIVNASCAAVTEMGDAKTFRGYPPSSGYNFLKNAIINYYKSFFVELEEDEIFVSDGAKTDLYAALSVFSPLTALIHNPVYPAYYDGNIIMGNRVAFIDSNKENSFLPLPEDIQKNDYKKPHLIYICSPDNPTGAVYGYKALKRWINYAIESDSVIIFDAAYSFFIRGDYPRSVFEIPGAEKCAIEVNSLSKSANFTGVRCGWTVIKKQLKIGGECANAVFSRIKNATFNGVSYPVQCAARAALSNEGLAECSKNTDYYLKNAKILKDVFISKKIYAVGGENSPYVFFECPNKMPSFSFFDLLLNEISVAATPGVGFGSMGEGFIRLSGLNTYENTIEAASRLKKFL